MARRDVGIAIGLPEPYSSELQGFRHRLGDPHAGGIPPHITLLPPTALDDEQLAEVEEHLRRVAAAESAFEVVLHGSASFRPVSPVVFVPLVRGQQACARIEQQVRSGPLRRPLSFPYFPHVTVAHDLGDQALDRASAELAGYRASFQAWGFTMYEHGADKMWRPQRDFRFGLDGRPGPAAPPD